MTTIELHPTFPALTRREQVVLSNLTEDVTLEQIANRLFVTRNTVKSQVRSVYKKLGVSTRAEAVAMARRLGLY
ncbi:LuxR C-terminal-related transcriptional regulator [Antribacter sp. KLBMP9083]|uniref:LuxR C-terminal-related transcriptional regulator n=1 Tax=Antribacter soli TaxID=2910976 RepID=A0AA41U6P1_9MICO|nr:LuxR C-terminal-related transcriptional regulator [Antribacter soli]MCF4120495.1 LuxR C-terminal-related transcriptional regulator [Antribacter soli]